MYLDTHDETLKTSTTQQNVTTCKTYEVTASLMKAALTVAACDTAAFKSKMTVFDAICDSLDILSSSRWN